MPQLRAVSPTVEWHFRTETTSLPKPSKRSLPDPKKNPPEATGPPGLQTKQDDEFLPDNHGNRLDQRSIRCRDAHRGMSPNTIYRRSLSLESAEIPHSSAASATARFQAFSRNAELLTLCPKQLVMKAHSGLQSP